MENKNAVVINNIQDTINFAHKLTQSIKKSDIILLKGNLGVGKTTLAKEIIRTIAKDPYLSVTSPTFSILQVYNIPTVKIYHFDLYRIKSKDELLEVGIEEALENGLSIIEWPEIIEDTLKTIKCIVIDISLTKNIRKYEVYNSSN